MLSRQVILSSHLLDFLADEIVSLVLGVLIFRFRLVVSSGRDLAARGRTPGPRLLLHHHNPALGAPLATILLG